MIIRVDGDKLVKAIQNGRSMKSGYFYICVCGEVLFHRDNPDFRDPFELSHATGMAHVPWLNGATGRFKLPSVNGREDDPVAMAYQLAKDIRHRLNAVKAGHPIPGWFPPENSRYEWATTVVEVRRVTRRRKRVRRARVLTLFGRFMTPVALATKLLGAVFFTLMSFILTPLELLSEVVPKMELMLSERRFVEEYEPRGRVVTRTRVRAIEVVHQEVHDQ